MDIKSPVAEARNQYSYSAGGVKLSVSKKWNPDIQFAPDNSKVEWSIASHKNSSGSSSFTLKTSFNNGEVSNVYSGRDKSDLLFHMHSHPGGDDTKMASGYYDGENFMDGDGLFMASYFNAAKNANKKYPNEYPRLYIYHRKSEGVYHYNHQTASEYVGNAATPITLRTLVNKHKMKRVVLFLLVTLGCISSCKRSSLEMPDSQSKDIFCPVLKKGLLDMIQMRKKKQESGDNSQRICSVIISTNFKDKEECTVTITLMPRIDPQLLTGYTFIENEIIACYLLSDSCSNNNIISSRDLIQFKDSIIGYPNILKYNPDLIYDAPSYTYKIMEDDSLQLIKSFLVD